jgi:hypothetical protein
VEADARYLAVTRIVLEPGAAPVHRRAQEEAATERDALLERIPRLTIAVAGSSAADATVTLDGKPVPAALVGVEQSVDPGTHLVAVTRPGAPPASQSVTLGERQTRRVSLDLAAAALLPPSSPEMGTHSGNGRRTAGWVLVAVGATGLAVGAVAGGLALSKKGPLDSECTGANCGPAYYGDVDSYDTMRLVSGTGFIAGGVVLVVGAALVLTAPATARTTAWVAARPGGGTFALSF